MKEKEEKKTKFCRNCIHCKKYPRFCEGVERPDSCIWFEERTEDDKNYGFWSNRCR